MHVFLAKRDLDDLGRLAHDKTAVHVDFAVSAHKADAARAGAMDHLDSARVNVAQAGSRPRIFGWYYLDGAGCVHAQAPLRDVEMMCAPVGHHAAGVLD